MDKKQDNPNKSKNLHKPPIVLSFLRFMFRYLGLIFPSLMARWASHFWYKTHRIDTLPRELKWLHSARTKAVNIHCDRLKTNPLAVMTYYWQNEKADAPLVMLVHGWTGRGSQMAAFAQALLKAGFSVLAFDNHAHAQTAGKSTDIFIQSEVQQKVNEMFGPAYAIIAHSFGGMVTPYSLNHGMQTQKVVLISPPARFYYLMERFSQSLHLPEKVQQKMIKSFKQEYGDNLTEHVSATYTSKQLGHIPALIIHDEDDKDVPISEGELLHQSWPNSKMIRTRGLGHRRILYDSQVIENTVNFIK